MDGAAGDLVRAASVPGVSIRMNRGDGGASSATPTSKKIEGWTWISSAIRLSASHSRREISTTSATSASSAASRWSLATSPADRPAGRPQRRVGPQSRRVLDREIPFLPRRARLWCGCASGGRVVLGMSGVDWLHGGRVRLRRGATGDPGRVDEIAEQCGRVRRAYVDQLTRRLVVFLLIRAAFVQLVHLLDACMRAVEVLEDRRERVGQPLCRRDTTGDVGFLQRDQIDV